jgi:hypothetical protein
MKYFSKIKKAVACALLATSILLIGVGMTACKGGSSSEDNVPTLYGFEVNETINVDQYGLVLPENVHVTGEDGTMYDVVVTVRDSNGNIIPTDEGNKFNAYDAKGYTITYSIDTWEFSVAKTVQVIVKSLTEDLDFEIDCDTLVSVGDTVTVGVDGNISNAQYVLSVVNKETGAACETDGLTFKATEIGVYTLQVSVQADEGSATKEMELYARKALQEGEVEVFEEDWRSVRAFSPKYVAEEGTWSVATTEETGIKDIGGNDGTYAVLETDAEYTHIYFNIRESRAYYRNLAMQGYTHVRFRVYVDSPTGRGKLFNWEHDSTNSWRTSLGNAPAGEWKEFYIPLATGVAGSSDKKPGFIESYDYYQGTWILLLDNSTGAWNTNGREVDEEGKPLKFKIYFDDIFAVRRTYETTVSTTADKDVYDLSSLLERAWGTETEDYTYNITKYTEYGTNKKQLVSDATLTSNDVNLSELTGNDGAYGSYEISYFIKNTDTEIPYRKIWLNVFDSDLEQYGYEARGMIWRYQDATASVRANADGSLVYTTAGSWGAGLQIAPAYTQDYYRTLHNQGYKLTFDLKLEVEYNEGATEAEKASPYQICTLAQGQNGTQYKNGETHTLTIGLDKIVTHYKKLQNVGLGSDPDTDWFAEYVLFHVQYENQVYAYNHSKLTFTISNFKLVK